MTETTETLGIVIDSVAEMAEAVKSLARLRQEYTTTKEMLDHERALVVENYRLEHRIDLAYAAATLEAMNATFAAIKAAAVEHYRLSGEKKPTTGVSIRVLTKHTIPDETNAIEWAIAHDHVFLLHIDTPAFVKVALVAAPQLLVTTFEAQATIATDLSVLLASEEAGPVMGESARA